MGSVRDASHTSITLFASDHLLHGPPTTHIYTLSLHDALPILQFLPYGEQLVMESWRRRHQGQAEILRTCAPHYDLAKSSAISSSVGRKYPSGRCAEQ